MSKSKEFKGVTGVDYYPSGQQLMVYQGLKITQLINVKLLIYSPPVAETIEISKIRSEPFPVVIVAFRPSVTLTFDEEEGRAEISR